MARLAGNAPFSITTSKSRHGCVYLDADSNIKTYLDVVDVGPCRGCIRVWYKLPDGGVIAHVLASANLAYLGLKIFAEYMRASVPMRRWRFLAHRGKVPVNIFGHLNHANTAHFHDSERVLNAEFLS